MALNLGTQRAEFYRVVVYCATLGVILTWLNRIDFLTDQQKAAGEKLRFSASVFVSAILAAITMTILALLLAGAAYLIARIL